MQIITDPTIYCIFIIFIFEGARSPGAILPVFRGVDHAQMRVPGVGRCVYV